MVSLDSMGTHGHEPKPARPSLPLQHPVNSPRLVATMGDSWDFGGSGQGLAKGAYSAQRKRNF